eukprot:5150716-Pyramimonas_sp.AAC.1
MGRVSNAAPAAAGAKAKARANAEDKKARAKELRALNYDHERAMARMRTDRHWKPSPSKSAAPRLGAHGPPLSCPRPGA